MVTTLPEPRDYPLAELPGLRLRRWGVETEIGHLKTTMRSDVLRCPAEAGLRKELAVFCLVYNVVRLVLLPAARRQEVPGRPRQLCRRAAVGAARPAGRRDARTARQPK